MAQDTPLLSRSGASDNLKEYLIPCLESILAQETQYPYEVIIIDDCSSDGSWDLIQKYNTEHRFSDRIHIYQSSENQGSARAAMFNTRAKARGKYICNIDGDDMWYSKDKIERQLSFLENNPDYVGASHLTIKNHEGQSDVGGDYWGVRPPAEWTIQDVVTNEHRCYSHLSSNIWRNNYIQDDGFFLPDFMKDKFYMNDTTMSAMYASNGGKIISLPDIYSVYRIHGKGVWNSKSLDYMKAVNIREWYSIDAVTHYQYHDLINVRLLDGIMRFEQDFGQTPPISRPELLPEGVDSIPPYLGIDDDTPPQEALKTLILKNREIWVKAGY